MAAAAAAVVAERLRAVTATAGLASATAAPATAATATAGHMERVKKHEQHMNWRSWGLEHSGACTVLPFVTPLARPITTVALYLPGAFPPLLFHPYCSPMLLSLPMLQTSPSCQH
ncbi:hypothetical protein Vretimale_9836 [Volvox reticuliferus]|uniref:Uncharacterized protein n=1 Tax=Volvox reticuliferus TaxID=1737510 RepID=A0A8J4LPU4_9CHLO|nr:hypothetical protein Vretimale_9836 [Volvox reticuliferus]